MTTTTDYPEGAVSIAVRFAAFHETNPHIYERLVRMARALKSRGRDRLGISMLFEVLRWEHATETDDPTSDLKLNNGYKPHYARLIMEREPDLAGIFETRELRT